MDNHEGTIGSQQASGNATAHAKHGNKKLDRGMLHVDQNECKGCGLCVEACPPEAIQMNEQLNRYGYRTAIYSGAGCTGCGICFLACPEPGAITVLRAIAGRAAKAGSIEVGCFARAI